MFTSLRAISLGTFLAVAAMISCGVTPSHARTVGQVIDDTAITTAIKARLTTDKVSNLTKIAVKTEDGIVTLAGTVDTAERQARAEQIAAQVKGVRGIVNNIHVTGTTVGPTPVTSVPSPVDATGIVAQVDPARGTITLQDGRVLSTTNQTMVWQLSTIQSVRPGAQVIVRGAAPAGFQPTAAMTAPEWRMGTVRRIDRANYQIVLTDGTVVRIAPSANIHRGPDRLTFDQLVPGAEVVVRIAVSESGSAAGSALPGPTAVAPVVDASEINVVGMPAAGLR